MLVLCDYPTRIKQGTREKIERVTRVLIPLTGKPQAQFPEITFHLKVHS